MNEIDYYAMSREERVKWLRGRCVFFDTRLTLDNDISWLQAVKIVQEDEERLHAARQRGQEGAEEMIRDSMRPE